MYVCGITEILHVSQSMYTTITASVTKHLLTPHACWSSHSTSLTHWLSSRLWIQRRLRCTRREFITKKKNSTNKKPGLNSYARKYTHKILFNKLKLVIIALLVRVTVLEGGAFAWMEVAVALPMATLPVPVSSSAFAMAPVVMVRALLAAWGPMPAGGLLPAMPATQTSLIALSDTRVHRVMPQQRWLEPPIT